MKYHILPPSENVFRRVIGSGFAVIAVDTNSASAPYVAVFFDCVLELAYGLLNVKR